MISSIVQEFCSHYGFSGLSMEDEGRLKLSIEGVGDFEMIHNSPKFLAGLQRKIENPYLLTGEKVLSHCHFKETNVSPVHAQMRNDTLGLFYVFNETDVTASLLSTSLDSLVELMDKILG